MLTPTVEDNKMLFRSKVKDLHFSSKKKTLKSYETLGSWKPILPASYSKMKGILDSFLVNADEVEILIVDDTDTDGFGSTKICYSKLKQLFPNCTIKVNKDETKIYDLVIILDSSSSLIETYENLCQIIVIDHHEYNHDLKCPDNVLLINSKDTKGLESISAGMLSYILFSQYLKDHSIKDYDSLFDIACMTLYSDIVPVDDFVQTCLGSLMKMTEFSKTLNALNLYHEPINKNTLSYSIIPLINYTRRLNDSSTLKLLYQGKEEAALNFLLRNKEIGRNIFDVFRDSSDVDTSYKNFVFVDVTFAVENIVMYPLQNFKGVYANRVSDQYNKPAIVGFMKDEKFYFSVRSNNINSLSFFLPRVLDGGGHNSACGFVIDIFKLTVLLKAYDEYLNNCEYDKPNIIEINSIEDLDLFDLAAIAIENEFRYSNYKVTVFKVKSNQAAKIKNVNLNKKTFTIDKYTFKCYNFNREDVEVGEMTITPTFTSIGVQAITLITSFKKGVIQGNAR